MLKIIQKPLQCVLVNNQILTGGLISQLFQLTVNCIKLMDIF